MPGDQGKIRRADYYAFGERGNIRQSTRSGTRCGRLYLKAFWFKRNDCACARRSSPLSSDKKRTVPGGKAKVCRVWRTDHQPDKLFCSLWRKHCWNAAKRTGAFILSRLISESGIYKGAAPWPYMGLWISRWHPHCPRPYQTSPGKT